MNYCDKCHLVVEKETCPHCGNIKLREVNSDDYCFVAEKEEMWAKMFMDILGDQGIPYANLPACGTAMTMKAGMIERQRIYVPYEALDQALQLLKESFD